MSLDELWSREVEFEHNGTSETYRGHNITRYRMYLDGGRMIASEHPSGEFCKFDSVVSLMNQIDTQIESARLKIEEDLCDLTVSRRY